MAGFAIFLFLLDPFGVIQAPGSVLATQESMPLADRLVGRRALLVRYVGSSRNASFGRAEQRRPVSTIVEGKTIRYVASLRFVIPLERSRTLSLEELRWYDRRLRAEPSLRGFEPGEQVHIDRVEVEEGGAEIEVTGLGSDRREGRVVVRYEDGAPALSSILRSLWQVLVVEPPYESEDEELGAMVAAVHVAPVSDLAGWFGLTREQAVRRVASATLDLEVLPIPDRQGIEACYERSYLVLSDRSGMALTELSLQDTANGRFLLAKVLPHRPLPGDWPDAAARAEAAFRWSTAKVLTNLARNCSDLGVVGFAVSVGYDYREWEGPLSEVLESRVPAAAAVAFAELRITMLELASEGEHRLNGLPIRIGDG